MHPSLCLLFLNFYYFSASIFVSSNVYFDQINSILCAKLYVLKLIYVLICFNNKTISCLILTYKMIRLWVWESRLIFFVDRCSWFLHFDDSCIIYVLIYADVEVSNWKTSFICDLCRGHKKFCLIFCILHGFIGLWKRFIANPSIMVASIFLSLSGSIFSFSFETWMVVQHEKVCWISIFNFGFVSPS